MITAPLWLVSNWRAIGALAVAGAMLAAVLYYRGEAALAQVEAARAIATKAKSERDLEAMRGAYMVLAASVQRQNAALQELEAVAEAAAQRGAKARADAAGVVDVAMRSAEALAKRMREPATTECPAGEGLAVVREDWRGGIR
jgi:hypothetical protein